MEIEIRTRPEMDQASLNALYAAAWPNHQEQDVLRGLTTHCLGYVGAYAGEALVGFAKLAWDGDLHAFLLDPTVHPAWQRRGIGRRLVQRLVEVARESGMEWVHVDYEQALHPFYQACGFAPTPAGVLWVSPKTPPCWLTDASTIPR